MNSDPLFNPYYLARAAKEFIREDPQDEWILRNFCAGCLPKAGKPWKLPPPVTEGQELAYRFYDDASRDREVFVIAAVHNGVLQWVHIKSKDCPRRMVGTNWPK